MGLMDKLDDGDQEKTEKPVQETLNWSDKNQLDEKDELEGKQKQLDGGNECEAGFHDLLEDLELGGMTADGGHEGPCCRDLYSQKISDLCLQLNSLQCDLNKGFVCGDKT